jgi:thiosulfate/3-mercaptopyruvate sulfurtransferase
MSEPLVEPAELEVLLGAYPPPVLADVRWRLGGPPGRPEYEAGHLPGAHYVDLETELSGPPGRRGRHPLPDPADFQAVMRRIGVRADSLVVAYDDASSQAAARLWWLLTDADHAHVRVLNGGLAAWRAAGLPLEVGAPPRARPGDFVARPGQRAQYRGEDIAQTLGRPTAPQLVDVRAPERYAGTSEPIDPIAGRIPGAVNLPATGNVDADGRFLPAEVLAERFDGIGPDAVFYCGSGVTASQGLLALEITGRSAALYPGSWSEWITDPSRPIERDVRLSTSMS